jgi:hypothetical protein
MSKNNPTIKNKNPLNIKSSTEAGDNLVIYPPSKDLRINHSDLKLELADFAVAIKNEPNIGVFLTLVSLWVVIFSSDFKSMFGFQSHDVFIFFLFVTSFLTLFIVTPVFVLLFRLSTGFDQVKSKWPYLKKWHYKNEIDPENKANNIINRSLENK